MNASVASLAVTVGPALVTCWFGYRLGLRSERAKERRDREVLAASDLVAPLRELQQVLRRFGCQEVGTDEVADAMLHLSAAFNAHRHRLPPAWTHIAHSVRDATGTAFGGGSLVHVRPDLMPDELADPDPMWHDFADDYLDYVTDRLLRWGDWGTVRNNKLLSYQDWLVWTGRRETFGEDHLEPHAVTQ